MIRYSGGNVAAHYDEVVELCGTWWNDTLFYKLYGIEYKPCKEIFVQAEKMGLLVPILGRNEEGKLVSCYLGMKCPYPFNTSVMTVMEFTWCIHKDYRTFLNLMGLIKEIDRVMTDLKVHLYSLAVPDDYPALAKIMKRKGYNKMENGYSKFRRNNDTPTQ